MGSVWHFLHSWALSTHSLTSPGMILAAQRCQSCPRLLGWALHRTFPRICCVSGFWAPLLQDVCWHFGAFWWQGKKGFDKYQALSLPHFGALCIFPKQIPGKSHVRNQNFLQKRTHRLISPPFFCNMQCRDKISSLRNTWQWKEKITPNLPKSKPIFLGKKKILSLAPLCQSAQKRYLKWSKENHCSNQGEIIDHFHSFVCSQWWCFFKQQDIFINYFDINLQATWKTWQDDKERNKITES